MPTTASIAQSLQGTAATNGWDAVFALNLPQINAVMLQQYLEHGPPTTAQHLRVMFNTGTARQYAILDFELGPPELSFQAASPGAKLELELIKGKLVTFHPVDGILSAVWIRPKELKLTGPLTLASVKGEVNQVGKVVLELAASAYAPIIAGVAPKSEFATQIGQAAQTFFANNAATVTVGTIASANVPAALMPTAFKIATQSNPTDTCVLLLIQTNGKAGTDGPLPAYPIPDQHTAALLIGEPTLFGGTFVETLNKIFNPSGATFQGNQSQAGWSTSAKSGAINFGQIGTPNSQDSCWSGGAVAFPLNNLTIQRSGGALKADWTSASSQNWYKMVLYSTPGNWHSGSPGRSWWAPSDPSSLTLSITYKWQGTPRIDPTNGIVSFFTDPNVEKCDLNPDLKTSAYNFWGIYSVSIDNNITQAILAQLKTDLEGAFKLVDVNTFALQSLLFHNHEASLTEAALPRDLYLAGSLKQPITVTPADAMVTPGGTVQFNAVGSSNILWEIAPRSVGSISAGGLYTAPSSLPSAELVVVSAIDKSNASLVGRALLLVYQRPAAQGVAVSPAKSLVAPGLEVELFVTDAAGKPIAVKWTLSPNTGEIKGGLDEGSYSYEAPSSITQPTAVTATATSATNPALTGTAMIDVVSRATIGVQAAQKFAKPGASVALTASVTAGDKADLRWVVYPSGVGSVAFDPNDPTKATYTAPSSISKDVTKVHPVAYLVDEQAAGVGLGEIALMS